MGSEAHVAPADRSGRLFQADSPDRPPAADQAPGRLLHNRTLLAHVLAVVLTQSVWFGVTAMMALLARKRFGANDWETLIVTASIPTFLMMSIFWNEVLRRTTLRRYMMIHWASQMPALVVAAFADQLWQLMACFAVSAIGHSGWSPMAGDMVKRFYGDRVRGRAFGVLTTAAFAGMMGTSYLIGRCLDASADSFRWYFPVAAFLYLMGMLVFRRLVHTTGADAARENERIQIGAFQPRKILEPILHMTKILKEDPRFSRYEAAFMTYGIGWMICNALLPVLATDRFHMSYAQFATSTQVLYPAGLLLLLYPMGLAMDRIGPSKTSGVSFALLMLYPLGLMSADSISFVSITSLIYGASMAGVQIAWTLGPVSLAPSSEKVAHYAAIHASLVGIRGVVAQGLGMLLYRLTNSFTWPMVIASLAFAWASAQMFRLHRMSSTGLGKAPSNSP